MKKAGRPTKYNEKVLKQAIEYIDKDMIPTVQGLAYLLAVHKDTLYEWADKHKPFSDALEKLKNRQATLLIKHGLTGTFNSTIAKLLLTVNHDMKERVDVTSNDETMNTGPILIDWGKDDGDKS